MAVPDIGEVIGQAVRDAVAPLAAQLQQERARADRLWLELLESRVSERMADRAAAEADELRRRADEAVLAERVARTEADDAHAAEQVARAEADDLRAVLDTRQQWGLGKRLRWALGRKQ